MFIDEAKLRSGLYRMTGEKRLVGSDCEKPQVKQGLVRSDDQSYVMSWGLRNMETSEMSECMKASKTTSRMTWSCRSDL